MFVLLRAPRSNGRVKKPRYVAPVAAYNPSTLIVPIYLPSTRDSTRLLQKVTHSRNYQATESHDGHRNMLPAHLALLEINLGAKTCRDQKIDALDHGVISYSVRSKKLPTSFLDPVTADEAAAERLEMTAQEKRGRTKPLHRPKKKGNLCRVGTQISSRQSHLFL